MNNNRTTPMMTQNYIMLLIVSILQTVTLIIGIGGVPITSRIATFFPNLFPNNPERLLWIESRFWLFGLVLGGITFLLALLLFFLDWRAQRREEREAARRPDRLLIGPNKALGVEPLASQYRPKLLLGQSIAVSIFTVATSLLALLAQNSELLASLPMALFFGSGAILLWCLADIFHIYYLNQIKPRNRATVIGMSGAGLRIVGSLTLWVYLGMIFAAERLFFAERLTAVFYGAAALLLVGLVMQLLYLFMTRTWRTDLYGQVWGDRLTRLYNVTPELQQRLIDHDIITYGDVARSSSVDLRHLAEEGARAYLQETATWPYQAQLKREGSDALSELQAHLQAYDGPFDALQHLLGVTPAIEMLLWQRGIFGYRQMSEMTSQELQEMNPPLLGADGAIVDQGDGPLYHWTTEQLQLWPTHALLLLAQQLIGDQLGHLTSLMESVSDRQRHPYWGRAIALLRQKQAQLEAGLRFIEQEKRIDPLHAIEGISARIAQLLTLNGIVSFAQLASLSPEEGQALLIEADIEGHRRDVERWIAHAKIGAQEGVEGLSNLKTAFSRDDLTQIEGVDSAHQDLLRRQDIQTFSDLASVNGEGIGRLIEEMADLDGEDLSPILLTTWPYQAALLRQGKEHALARLQTEIKERSVQTAVFCAGLVALQQIEAHRHKELGEIITRLSTREPHGESLLQTVTHLEQMSHDLEEVVTALKPLQPYQLEREALLQQLQGVCAQDKDEFDGHAHNGDSEASGGVVKKSSEQDEPTSSPRQSEEGIDDLALLVGVTPEVAQHLQERDVGTFEALAKVEPLQIRRWLEEAGTPFQLNLLFTWPYQAHLAHQKAWQQLTQEQGLLRGQLQMTPASDPFVQVLGLDTAVADYLQAQGLSTLQALAAQSADELRQWLMEAEPPLSFRQVDVMTWPRQAALLLSDDQDGLAELQQELRQGYGGDDLTRIEGIGPQIEMLLYRGGLQTYAQLADTPVEHLREILTKAGESFRIANYPETWPQQAALARDGAWTELSTLQQKLKGGRTPDAPPKPLADDLTIIEGIGVKIEALLQQAGILTYAQLAETAPQKLTGLLIEAGPAFRLANKPETWPIQAALARDEAWQALDALKKALKGGVSVADEDENAKQDDLTLIEGIGPKIQALLYKANLDSYRALVESGAEKIRQLIDEAGSSFQLANHPETWPQQAKLLLEGDFEELLKLQQRLKGGQALE